MLDLLFVTALYYAQHPLEVGLAWCGLAHAAIRRGVPGITVTWNV